MIDAAFLEEARAELPAALGDYGEQCLNCREGAIVSLLALKALAEAAAHQLCVAPENDAGFDYLALGLGNQMQIFARFIEMFRAVRDKPGILN